MRLSPGEMIIRLVGAASASVRASSDTDCSLFLWLHRNHMPSTGVDGLPKLCQAIGKSIVHGVREVCGRA